MTHRPWSLLPLLPLVAAACTFDTGESLYCDRQVVITGEVEGVSVGFDDYQVQSVWFNTSIEEAVEQELSSLDREIMEEMGLDPDDSEDVERYRYFNQAYDLRFLFIEQLDEGQYGALGATIGRDLGVYFFDLAESEVQPGTSVEVFDLSSIEGPRDRGNRDALGEAMRTAIDTMRSDGKPNALVAFDPDRTDDGQPRSAFITLFAGGARFGTSGTASFGDGMDSSGAPLESIVYPLEDVDNLGLSVDATLSGGEVVTVEASCVVVDVSG